MQPVIESNLTSMARHIEVNLSLVCFKSRYFSQVCPKRDDLVGLWRWCVGFIWPFSPSFTSLVFFVACHIWPEQELWLWPSRRSSPWKLTAEISQSWNIFVFRSLKSCFEAPMSPLFTGESKSETTCNWPPFLMIGCIYFFLASIKLCICPILFWCTLHIFSWYDRTHFTTETFLSISYQIAQNEVQIQTPNDLSTTNSANCQRCFRLSTLCLTCPPTYVILEKKKKGIYRLSSPKNTELRLWSISFNLSVSYSISLVDQSTERLFAVSSPSLAQPPPRVKCTVLIIFFFLNDVGIKCNFCLHSNIWLIWHATSLWSVFIYSH